MKPILLEQLKRFAARMPGARFVGAPYSVAFAETKDFSIWEDGSMSLEDGIKDARALYDALKILFEEEKP